MVSNRPLTMGWLKNSDICTSNGYCISSKSVRLYRGACSKEGWDTNACASVCMSGTFSNSFNSC